MPVSLLTFQSHLYGIERVIQGREPGRVQVSIAPLWNWKSRLGLKPASSSSFNRTFMELKDASTPLEALLQTVSIAPLWNWKIFSLLRKVLERVVSIAPLWNWKMMVKIQFGKKRKFQSHLYGIERCICSRISFLLFCFNRTFMELKVWMLLRLLALVMFQSHLYGIESTILLQLSLMLLTFQSHLYGIESLFPWGVIIGVEFQSHLYGIESSERIDAPTTGLCFNRTFMELKVPCDPEESARNNVSIAPLWNWKGGDPRGGPGGVGFNRTFMELKATRHRGALHRSVFQSHLYGIESGSRFLLSAVGLRVSIAPLWNWKICSFVRKVLERGFNRTFMELKG